MEIDSSEGKPAAAPVAPAKPKPFQPKRPPGKGAPPPTAKSKPENEGDLFEEDSKPKSEECWLMKDLEGD